MLSHMYPRNTIIPNPKHLQLTVFIHWSNKQLIYCAALIPKV